MDKKKTDLILIVITVILVGVLIGGFIYDRNSALLARTNYFSINEDSNLEIDKMEKAGFHTTKAEFVDAPIIDELPMALECKLLSYDTEEHIMIAEVVNVNADESVLNENGKVDIQKLRPIAFDAMNGAYVTLGEKVGNAFKDGAALK
jgi:flavin reductase (DIM6/NTAB) family NADH-FMN oxidoreductase RutF